MNDELIKRFIDVALSGIALVFLSPLLLPAMILLKLTGEHYVFYLQPRIGRRRKSFNLLKFATMLKNSPNIGTGDITTQGDSRVLPLGHFFRKTKLNELPQLFNIIKGDMGIIGPRPLTPRNFAFYPEDVQEIIGRMRPGLSGIGSIVFRDEEFILTKLVATGLSHEEAYRQHITPYKGALEVWYFNHSNIWLDLKLIMLTAIVVLFPKTDPTRFIKELPPKTNS